MLISLQEKVDDIHFVSAKSNNQWWITVTLINNIGALLNEPFDHLAIPGLSGDVDSIVSETILEVNIGDVLIDKIIDAFDVATSDGVVHGGSATPVSGVVVASNEMLVLEEAKIAGMSGDVNDCATK
jgi:hypothetical protein